MSALTEQVVMEAKSHGQEALAARLFQLARPLVAIFDGQGKLAGEHEVPYNLVPGVVLALFGVEPTPDNEAEISLGAFPLDCLEQMPSELEDYRLHFMNLVATERDRAIETFGKKAMEETFENIKELISTDLFLLWGPYLDRALAHFEPIVFLMVGQSYLAMLAMAFKYASIGNEEMMSRLAPALRFMARVIPIGFSAEGSYDLLALCRG